VAAPVDQGLVGDDVYMTYSLPFAFPYYGTNRTAFRIYSNGFLNSGTAINGNSYSNSDAHIIDNVRIAPLWDDLKLTLAGQDVFIDESISDQVTIRWKGTKVGSSVTCEFSVTLHASGAIDFNYGPGNNPITASVGISSGDGTRYTLSAYNPATDLENVNSVRLAQPPQLSPGMSVSGTGEISGTPLEAGSYLPRIRVTDSLGRTDEVFLSLTVVDVPGDVDGDGDIDLADFVALIDCMTGPDQGPVANGCEAADMDNDNDVDLQDAMEWTLSLP